MSNIIKKFLKSKEKTSPIYKEGGKVTCPKGYRYEEGGKLGCGRCVKIKTINKDTSIVNKFKSKRKK